MAVAIVEAGFFADHARDLVTEKFLHVMGCGAEQVLELGRDLARGEVLGGVEHFCLRGARGE